MPMARFIISTVEGIALCFTIFSRGTTASASGVSSNAWEQKMLRSSVLGWSQDVVDAASATDAREGEMNPEPDAKLPKRDATGIHATGILPFLQPREIARLARARSDHSQSLSSSASLRFPLNRAANVLFVQRLRDFQAGVSRELPTGKDGLLRKAGGAVLRGYLYSDLHGALQATVQTLRDEAQGQVTAMLLATAVLSREDDHTSLEGVANKLRTRTLLYERDAALAQLRGEVCGRIGSTFRSLADPSVRPIVAGTFGKKAWQGVWLTVRALSDRRGLDAEGRLPGTGPDLASRWWEDETFSATLADLAYDVGGATEAPPAPQKRSLLGSELSGGLHAVGSVVPGEGAKQACEVVELSVDDGRLRELVAMPLALIFAPFGGMHGFWHLSRPAGNHLAGTPLFPYRVDALLYVAKLLSVIDRDRTRYSVSQGRLPGIGDRSSPGAVGGCLVSWHTQASTDCARYPSETPPRDCEHRAGGAPIFQVFLDVAGSFEDYLRKMQENPNDGTKSPWEFILAGGSSSSFGKTSSATGAGHRSKQPDTAAFLEDRLAGLLFLSWYRDINFPIHGAATPPEEQFSDDNDPADPMNRFFLPSCTPGSTSTHPQRRQCVRVVELPSAVAEMLQEHVRRTRSATSPGPQLDFTASFRARALQRVFNAFVMDKEEHADVFVDTLIKTGNHRMKNKDQQRDVVDDIKILAYEREFAIAALRLIVGSVTAVHYNRAEYPQAVSLGEAGGVGERGERGVRLRPFLKRYLRWLRDVLGESELGPPGGSTTDSSSSTDSSLWDEVTPIEEESDYWSSLVDQHVGYASTVEHWYDLDMPCCIRPPQREVGGVLAIPFTFQDAWSSVTAAIAYARGGGGEEGSQG